MSKVEFLMDATTCDVIKFIVEDFGVSALEAISMFYSTIMFDKLHNEETGLYLESEAYVYDLFVNEYTNGVLIQDEI